MYSEESLRAEYEAAHAKLIFDVLVTRVGWLRRLNPWLWLWTWRFPS